MIKRILLLLLLIAGIASVAFTACAGARAQAEDAAAAHNPAGKASSEYQDWNPAFTGAFAWYNGSATQCGWHWAHDASRQCRVDLHLVDCGCDWCASSYAPTLSSDGPRWVAYTGAGNRNWCGAYPHADWSQVTGAAAGTYERWHNRDCGCGWCQGTGVDSASQTGGNPGSAAADYSWHGSNCGCGHCGHHGNYDNCYNRPRSSSAASRRGCGCGCC